MISNKTLFDKLQDEFCPTLDSSLIAALLVDINHDINGREVIPTREQIAELRTTLKELASQAETYSESSELDDVNFTSSQRGETVSSWTSPASISRNSQKSAASGSSQSSPSSSALTFLQKALPDLPIVKLKHALEGHEGDDTDLWDIIETILTQESIRELEERGSEVCGDEERDTSLLSADIGWGYVKKRKSSPETVRSPTKNKLPSKPKPKKLVLTDIRQQHHIEINQHPTSKRKSNPLHDPWAQLSSLSTRLSALLPPNTASYFSSYFHSPIHATSYEAARAALMSLCKSDEEGEDATVLINLLDIVMPENENLTLDQRTRIILDVDLSINVTGGRTNDALELTYLLRELDAPGIGVNHVPPPTSPSSLPASPTKSNNSTLPSGLTMPGDTLLSPESVNEFPFISPASGPLAQRSEDQWKSVPSRRKMNRCGSHSLSQGQAVDDDQNGYSCDADVFRLRMRQAAVRRDHALMDAAIMHRKGNRKNRFGEVAMYYAEKAREEQKLVKQEALNAARAMVLARRTNDGNHDVIDVHSTTVAEATTIVKEILEVRYSTSQNKPLKIITGKGKHSAGGVGVLKPALRASLTADGWVVNSFEAGLVVSRRS